MATIQELNRQYRLQIYQTSTRKKVKYYWAIMDVSSTNPLYIVNGWNTSNREKAERRGRAQFKRFISKRLTPTTVTKIMPSDVCNDDNK